MSDITPQRLTSLFVNQANKRYNMFMMDSFIKRDKQLLETIIFMIILYAWIALLFAIFGIFYPVALWITWVIICIILYKISFLSFPFPSQNLLSYILISLGFTLFIYLFTVPTIFSGRDQGSLSEAAMQLSQNHSLVSYSAEISTFFDIYGYGKALNFPGFFYTVDGGLITQFPLPYITFLSGFFGIFGITGLVIANSFLLFLFITVIVSIARYYMSHRYTLLFLIALLSSFAIGWFAKFTLSENIASALLWSSLILYLFFKEKTNLKTFIIFILTISLLLFSRIEGAWFFAIFIFLILRNTNTRTFIKKDIWWRALFPATTLFVIACAIIIVNMPFFLTMLKVSSNTATDIIKSSNSFTDTTAYLFSIYTLYGLLFPFIITVVASTLSLFYKKYRLILLPIVIMLPLFIYYLFPHISSDHPWMLRRFVFALLPATILISIIFISHIKLRFTKHALLLLLILTNIPAFVTFITYTENDTLLKQTMELSEQFNRNDLILVDKGVSGSGWNMITNPMSSLDHKHAVYFFNPNDFEKLNTDAFDRVFLITPNENINTYKAVFGSRMHYVKKYHITTSQLDLSKNKKSSGLFPIKSEKVIRGMIYEIEK